MGKSNTLQNTTPVVHDAYNFVAPVTGCATVDFNAQACGGAMTQAVAYSTFNPASPAANVIGDFGFSTTGIASFSFPVTSGGQYTIVVHDILETPTNALCANYTFTITYRTGCRTAGFDRNNDAKADPSYFRAATGSWGILNSTGGTTSWQFGQAGDTPTSGDYTGDGMTDASTYRPSTNTWFYSTSQVAPQSNVHYVPFGVAGDVPVPGDYDRDGKTDVALWRPSNGIWYVLRSATSTLSSQTWGVNGDIPTIGDFDGDLITDYAVVRPNQVGIAPTYVWHILQTNFIQGFPLAARWGTAGDKIVPGDYDGNGKTDIAVFRPSDGTWYVLPSNVQNAIPGTGSFGFQWGLTGDIPQPADYDGDRRTDFAVFRNGTWWISNSTNGTYASSTIVPFGNPTDQPVSAPYLVTP
ncbi:MAG TPA: VCBS repeat-containing protein [Pyrinomonadaceae bacterium]|nr:VCBS repeat-containing protein [Pyrinomonadaceae bacterium]